MTSHSYKEFIKVNLMKIILVAEYLHNEPKVYIPEAQHLHTKMKMVTVDIGHC